MENGMEKYVAKALEGYEANYNGITESIEKMTEQLESFKEHQSEMLAGIEEMRELLGLGTEAPITEETTPLTLVAEPKK